MKTTSAITSRTLAIVLAAGVAGSGAALAADAGTSASAIASMDRSVRSYLATQLTSAAGLLGLQIDAAGLAYASTPRVTVAGAAVRGTPGLAEVKEGAPLMLWYVNRPGSSAPPEYLIASLSPTGAAVLKDSRGAEVARGAASLGFTVNPEGYCDIDTGGDNVCLHCSAGGHDWPGGPFTWDVCFTI
jgi:hypothetical protein